MPLFDEELSKLVREINSLRGESALPPVQRDPTGRIRLDRLLTRVVDTRASDLLLVAGVPATARVDGKLLSIDPQPLDARAVRFLLQEILDASQIRSLEKGASLDFCFERTEIGRFRCNIHHQNGTWAAAIRAFPGSIPGIGELGLPQVISRFAALERGLVLLAGPAGCGKSTTLAALVDLINRTRNVHVITLEDPVEYIHAHRTSIVEQIGIGSDAASFAGALRSVLRQDPDVILVGEIRDLETMTLVLTAAETGHLVFSTLHTGTVPQTLDRIVDVFPDDRQPQVRAQLSLCLAGVVIQHLIPRCDGRGRAAAAEVLLATDGIRNLIRKGLNHQIPTQMAIGRASGMITLDDSLARLVNENKVSLDEAARRAVHAEEFRSFLR